MNYHLAILNDRAKIEFYFYGETHKILNRNKVATIADLENWIAESGFNEDQVHFVVHNYSMSVYFGDANAFLLGKLRFHE